jgi:uncharacterized protein (DUF885 family)
MSDLFDRIDSYVEERFDLDPIEATHAGAPGRDDRWTDLSPIGASIRAEHDRRFLDELAGLTPEGEAEEVALAFTRERLESRLNLFDAGEHLRELGALWSQLTGIRDVFPQMRFDNDADWHVAATRLEGLPVAVQQALDSLQAGIEQGLTAAQRQSRAVARTCLIIAGEEAEAGGSPMPWFADLVGSYNGTDEVLRARLQAAAAAADAAYGKAGHWLLDVYTPAATPVDGVGAERYARQARYYTGANLDLLETYQWGWDELARLHERVDRVVSQVTPGGTVLDTMAALDADPKYVLEGESALLAYLQGVIDGAMVELAGTVLDIPDKMKVCEAVIAPPGGPSAQYYTQPSEDFSRPGRTWWPTLGKTTFHSWPALSIWYHEGVPGHHQQVAYTMLQADRLSRLQRIEFISGHGEGWALYAERLMDELGKFDDPGYELGFLSGQCLRASRVIVDIGMHLELPLKDSPMAVLSDGNHAGEIWNRDLTVQFLIERGLVEPDVAASEADRYLGLPGQAISYKIGERVWLASRAAAQARLGDAFDLRAWHTAALRLGPLGLDPFYELASRL